MENNIILEDYEYAGFWSRFGANIIDTILLMIITVPFSMMIYKDFWISESLILGPADFLINYILPFIVIVLFWIFKGATPGKMALNIQIVNANTGKRLSVGQSIGRYFAYFPAAIPLCLGILWIVWDKRKQGWHDKLAKTVVIKKSKKETVVFK